ncbi:unnamed protein product [Nezara viridula]|uniref:Family 31 glucosidase KIAA1161 n=1 Tax=Nezara viridula TaxID=85310 RepID=A0A9P0E2R3_NEZVI|nr:unnamed protein product [Nezara viridula]
MRAPRRVFTGVGVLVLVLFVEATPLFKEKIYSPSYAEVFASRSSADVTLFSGAQRELKHTFNLSFDGKVGNLKHCAGNDDDVCVRWSKSAQLLVTKGPKNEMWTVTIEATQPLHVCFPLEGHQLYGGMVLEEYPIQRVNLTQVSFYTGDITRIGRLQNVMERFWYSSGGLNIRVNPDVPLFLSQDETQLCLTAKNEFPYPKDIPIKMSYVTCGNTGNIREALKCFFPMYDKPIPPTKIIADPIWSTWVEFERPIDQQKLIQFEKDITSHGFNASVIELDDAWETCHGNQTFDLKKFPDPKAMVDEIHSKGHLITLWVHPFLGPGCPSNLLDIYSPYVMKYPNGSVGITTWWNGEGAALFDFLNPETTKWYVERLHRILDNYGFDGFKFDAGEAAYIPGMSIKEQSVTSHRPNQYTSKYIKMASQFGTLTEVRVGAEAFQYKLMQRLQDRDSIWTSENLGLRSVITSVLQLSILGYGAILPDMVGGNCYSGRPSKELFIRWVQVNTFLPLIQFSLSPWSFDDETVQITRKFTALHNAYSERILKEFKDPHHPVINPLWWIAPEDKIALVSDSEFLLGEDLLVAPVLEQGATSRDIYLPRGEWRDENTGKVYTGPTTLKKYPAPLEVLPYFERIKS